jgi:uncharacterized membrane protein
MYSIVKLLHVAFVIAFVGNITTGFFWHAHAAATRDPRLIAHVVDGIIRSDRVFTIPGVIGIVVTGIVTAMNGSLPLLGTGWILWALILFMASGLIFMVRVAPLQRQLRDFAAAASDLNTFDYAQYRALAIRWERWGAAALLTPLGAVVLMVLKPVF